MTLTPAFRDISAEFAAFMGMNRSRDEGPQYRTAMDFARAPADEAWVFSCIQRLYRSAAGVPLRVYIRAGRDLIPADTDPSPMGDDLQYVLDYVNPVDMTGNDMKSYSVASMACWGESWLQKVRGRFGGPPQELYWLRSPDLDIQSIDGRTPTKIIYQPTGGSPQALTQRDLVPWKSPNLVTPLRGQSPLSAVGSYIGTGRQVADKANAMLNNESVPPGFWQIPKDAEFAKQDENLVRRTLRALRGPKKQSTVPIMPSGIDFKSIALTPRDAEMIALGKLSRMSVCAALGVPLVLAGDDDKNTVYGNLREAERIFWRGTMIPLLDSFADALNNWLVPDFDPTRKKLIVAFDYSEIEALRPTWDVEMNTHLAMVYAQVEVPNEVRRHFRLGPDVEWGDRPVPRTQIALRPDPATIGPDAIVAIDPANEAELPQPSGAVDADEAEVPESLRSYGKGLYRHPAVKAWVANPAEPLDTFALFAGRAISTETRLAIEAGLRRRDAAGAIADALGALHDR
jgi:HK97 family phage portal protein